MKKREDLTEEERVRQAAEAIPEEPVNSVFVPQRQGQNIIDQLLQETTAQLLTSVGFGELQKKAGGDDVEAVIKRLTEAIKGFPPLHCLAIRADAITWLKKLGVPGPTKWVDQALPKPQQTSSGGTDRLSLSEPDPWPYEVDGQELLKELTEILPRFLILPAHGAVTIALWILHTYATSVLSFSPLLKIHSPQMRCGKSTAVELIGQLVNKPIIASSMSTAALYRITENYSPTLLIDEADTIFDGNEALRRVVNSGHYKPLAYVYVCEGDNHEPTEFHTFGPKALALIGDLPPTISDRSIPIEMKRKKPTEKVDKINPLTARADFEPVRSKALRWVADNLDDLRRNLLQDRLPGIDDRANDHWCSLFTIAHTIGDPWPGIAHRAALSLSPPDEDIEGSVAGQLLADLRDLFDEHGAKKLPSEYIVRKLMVMEERPWPEYKNSKPITQRQIAVVLKGFKIRPMTMRIAGYAKMPRGYKREWFEETWERYIPSRSPATPDLAATMQQSNNDKPLSGNQDRNSPEDRCGSESPANPTGPGDVALLHSEKGSTGKAKEKGKKVKGSV